MTARMAAVLMALLVLAKGGPHVAAAANCDRACLKATLDQYLAAVIKHDPAAAPLDEELSPVAGRRFTRS